MAVVIVAALVESVFGSRYLEGGRSGSMTALEQLNAYLKRLESRIRLYAFWRGTALVLATGARADHFLRLDQQPSTPLRKALCCRCG